FDTSWSACSDPRELVEIGHQPKHTAWLEDAPELLERWYRLVEGERVQRMATRSRRSRRRAAVRRSARMSGLPELRGKVAVVTGGASGIGEAIAAQLLAEEMEVV